MAGQVPEAYMVARGCLECALYANYLDAEPSSWDPCRKRGDSDRARKECRNTFIGPNLFAALEQRSRSVADGARMLYEGAIDLGAHPNELAIVQMMDTEPRADGGLMFTYSLLSGDTDALRLCLPSVRDTDTWLATSSP